MSVVMFANVCDHCGKRGEEYAGMCSCEECLLDVCTKCDVEGERQDETGKTLCKKCYTFLADENSAYCIDDPRERA